MRLWEKKMKKTDRLKPEMTERYPPIAPPLSNHRHVVATSVYVCLRRVRDAADSERSHVDTKPEHSLHQRAFKRSENHERPCHLHRRVSEGQVWSITYQTLRHVSPEKHASRALNASAGEFPPVSVRAFLIWANKWGEKSSQDWKRGCSFHTAEEERWIMGAALRKHW